MTTADESQINEKLEELTLSDDLFPNFSTVIQGNLDNKDHLIIKYLTLLDQYNQAIEQLNYEFKEGFFNLSRANYASTSVVKPYGKDCWDDTVKAIKKVRENGQRFELIDVNEEEPETMGNGKKEKSLIRNRDKSKNSKKSEKTAKEPKRKYNPINMFGVLVPLQLRQSQSHFNKALPQLITLVNLREEMINLESEIKPLLSTEQITEPISGQTTSPSESERSINI